MAHWLTKLGIKPGTASVAGVGVLAAAMLAASGCEPPLPAALTDPDGVFIREPAISRILDDPDLTEDQQRQALRDLGITDESLIDFLIGIG
jgi:hypothetical protein